LSVEFTNYASSITWSFLNLANISSLENLKTVDSRIIWQDPALSQWEGAKERKSLASLRKKYGWW